MRVMYGFANRPYVEGETEEGVMESSRSFFFFGSTKRFLSLMHVRSDGFIHNVQQFRNTAPPGAEYLVLYRNAGSLRVDRIERIFALFTYE